MCFDQGPQRNDAGEARTRGPSVSSQALYHLTTALPFKLVLQNDFHGLSSTIVRFFSDQYVFLSLVLH